MDTYGYWNKILHVNLTERRTWVEEPGDVFFRRYGGGRWFLVNVLCETIFFLMLSPIMWFGHTMFLAGLVLGRKIGWTAQARDDHRVPWAIAARALWPQTALGWAVLLLLGATVPAAIPYALFIAAGPALAIPLAVVTSWPSVGRALMRAGIGALPEETAPPAPLCQLGLPAIDAAALRTGSRHPGSREAAVRNP